MSEKYSQENRHHCPLSEVQDDVLLLTIRKGWQDAAEARAELVSRGWKLAWIEA